LDHIESNGEAWLHPRIARKYVKPIPARLDNRALGSYN